MSMKVYVGKNIATIKNGKRRLIYPLNTRFIGDLEKRRVVRWLRAGWDIDRTVFLELKYPTTPLGSDYPSLVFSGIVMLLDRGVYFRVVGFSRGYFGLVDDMNMVADVFHEKLHLESFEGMLKGGKVLTEDDVVKREIAFVLQRFGREGFYRRRDHLIKFFESLEHARAVKGELAILFVWEYLTANYGRYAESSLDIPSSFDLNEMKESFKRIWLHYASLYSVVFRRDLGQILPNIKKWFLEYTKA